MALLEIQGLRVEFALRRQSLVALDNVSFAVDAGEILGIVGESGAGKSLTLDAIVGLIEPPGRRARGEIHLAGRRIDNLSDAELRNVRGKEIGTVFQDPMTSLNPLYTVGYQLVQTIRTHLDVGQQEARSRAIELLAEVGIPEPKRRFDFYPHQFSGGMRQRVVIALALCAEPRLILADEPTTALDVSTQAQVLDLLRRLCDEFDVGMVLISHDMGVIAQTADRVAVMYAGRIVEAGDVQTLMRSPLHPYTQALLSSVPTMECRAERLAYIDGVMPQLAEMPTGCAFHPRCSWRSERCESENPAFSSVEPSHSVACWLVDQRTVHG